MLKKIVSGGQTGVDRGALDAALAARFPCGGWCPAARKAENGPIPDAYPVCELPGAGYRERTRQNVIDSDGTLVIHFGRLSGGSLETVRFCQRFGKPVLVRNAALKSAVEIAQEAAQFVQAHSIAVLNVAGPRESSHAGARSFAEQVIRRLLATWA